MDGMFRVIKKPFTQLYSIHVLAFERKDDQLKQVPLVFIVMSGRKTNNYRAIFWHLKEHTNVSSLQTITSDFEAALWQAARKEFDGIQIKGCLFHWSQAVYLKIQEEGWHVDIRKTSTPTRL